MECRKLSHCDADLIWPRTTFCKVNQVLMMGTLGFAARPHSVLFFACSSVNNLTTVRGELCSCRLPAASVNIGANFADEIRIEVPPPNLPLSVSDCLGLAL